ncbi:MAG: ATP-binding protein, partial [Asticcacaulis sp.]
LCSNAIKFTEAGRVKVDASWVEGRDGSDGIAISVSDTGIGIDPDKLGTIFEKFVQADSSITRKFGGSGLGLAITRTLAEAMGGRTEVRSEVGVGSTFTVYLPLRLAEGAVVNATMDETSVRSEPTAHERPLVLLVEDYEPNILVAQSFLDEFGYTVDVARTGLEGYELGRTGRYAAILMDVQMPGMNGLEATRLLRQNEVQTGRARVSVIGMTAHALAGDRERCLDAGMDEYITKPFVPDMLEKMLSGMIHRPETGRVGQ